MAVSKHVLMSAGDPARTGLSIPALQQAVLDNLMYVQARFPEIATPFNWYMALAHSVRDRLLERWVNTAKSFTAPGVKVACYLSAEFLIGPQLANNLLGIEQNAREAMRALGQDLDALLEDRGRARPGQRRSGPARLVLSSTRSQRSRFPPSATAFVTSSGSSTKQFAMGGRSRPR